MHDPDHDLPDTAAILDDLGYNNLDPLPAHLDTDRLSPCDMFSDADMIDDYDDESSDHQDQGDGIEIPEEEGVSAEDLP